MKGDFENRFKERWEERKKRWEEKRGNRSRHGHIWSGVFILLIGVAALLKATVSNLPDWVFSWQSFLILLGLFSGIKHGFKGSAWFLLLLVGSAFLLRDYYPDLEIRRYILPVALIIIGGYLIVRPRRRHFGSCLNDEKKKTTTDGSGITEPPVADESFESRKDFKEDFIDSTSFFGGTKKNVISKNFKGGDIVNILSGTELDLTRADFTGTVVLELTIILGGTKLIIPSNWTVKSEAVIVVGGLEDKRNMQSISDNPDKVLLLKGTVILGGIEIKSY